MFSFLGSNPPPAIPPNFAALMQELITKPTTADIKAYCQQIGHAHLDYDLTPITKNFFQLIKLFPDAEGLEFLKEHLNSISLDRFLSRIVSFIRLQEEIKNKYPLAKPVLQQVLHLIHPLQLLKFAVKEMVSLYPSVSKTGGYFYKQELDKLAKNVAENYKINLNEDDDINLHFANLRFCDLFKLINTHFSIQYQRWQKTYPNAEFKTWMKMNSTSENPLRFFALTLDYCFRNPDTRQLLIAHNCEFANEAIVTDIDNPYKNHFRIFNSLPATFVDSYEFGDVLFSLRGRANRVEAITAAASQQIGNHYTLFYVMSALKEDAPTIISEASQKQRYIELFEKIGNHRIGLLTMHHWHEFLRELPNDELREHISQQIKKNLDFYRPKDIDSSSLPPNPVVTLSPSIAQPSPSMSTATTTAEAPHALGDDLNNNIEKLIEYLNSLPLPTENNNPRKEFVLGFPKKAKKLFLGLGNLHRLFTATGVDDINEFSAIWNVKITPPDKHTAVKFSNLLKSFPLAKHQLQICRKIGFTHILSLTEKVEDLLLLVRTINSPKERIIFLSMYFLQNISYNLQSRKKILFYFSNPIVKNRLVTDLDELTQLCIENVIHPALCFDWRIFEASTVYNKQYSVFGGIHTHFLKEHREKTQTSFTYEDALSDKIAEGGDEGMAAAKAITAKLDKWLLTQTTALIDGFRQAWTTFKEHHPNQSLDKSAIDLLNSRHGDHNLKLLGICLADAYRTYKNLLTTLGCQFEYEDIVMQIQDIYADEFTTLRKIRSLDELLDYFASIDGSRIDAFKMIGEVGRAKLLVNTHEALLKVVSALISVPEDLNLFLRDYLGIKYLSELNRGGNRLMAFLTLLPASIRQSIDSDIIEMRRGKSVTIAPPFLSIHAAPTLPQLVQSANASNELEGHYNTL